MSNPTPPAWRSIVTRYVIPLGAMVIAFAAGWTVGSGRASNDATTGWTDATVTVSSTEATVKADGKTYQFGQSLPGWLDKAGVWQENTWPVCLTDGFSGTVPVLVSTTAVDGTAITTVVAVHCAK
ncbi:MAG: hypothetical protein FWD11_02070 [Micrococcales bacterium]|nr:hypothetical protein [Micrococcales bacterium]